MKHLISGGGNKNTYEDFHFIDGVKIALLLIAIVLAGFYLAGGFDRKTRIAASSKENTLWTSAGIDNSINTGSTTPVIPVPVPVPTPRPVLQKPDQVQFSQTLPIPQKRPKRLIKPQNGNEESGEESVDEAAAAEAAAKARLAKQNPKGLKKLECKAMAQGRFKAEILPEISKGACGHPFPLKVSSLLGDQVLLARSPTLNCALAARLTDWAEHLDKLARKEFGARLVSIDSGPGYQCRRRYSDPTKKISQHALADAIDLFSFELDNGDKISVLDDWHHVRPQTNEEAEEEKPQEQEEQEGRKEQKEPITAKAKFLKTAHTEACKRFNTVLGPEYNKAHANHFHFDLLCHGKNCTYMVCD